MKARDLGGARPAGAQPPRLPAPDAAAYVGPRHRWRVAWLGRRLTAALARAAVDARRAAMDQSPAATPLLLDLGAGRGDLSLLLAARGFDVLAIDRSPRRLARLAEQVRGQGLAGRIHLCLADAQAMPLRAACLDGAACGEVLEHLDDDLAALRGLAAALKKGAPLALTVPAGPARLTDIDRRAGHRRRYGGAELVGRARAAGLAVDTLLPWGFPFGRFYDRCVQGPALRARAPAARNLAAGLAALRIVDALWQWLFRLDLRLGGLAPQQGSGWLLEARPASTPASDPPAVRDGPAGVPEEAQAPSRKA